jgi:hypothetical protein
VLSNAKIHCGRKYLKHTENRQNTQTKIFAYSCINSKIHMAAYLFIYLQEYIFIIPRAMSAT